MRLINIQQAKTHLSRLVEEVVAGEEIVIGKAGKPMAKLVAFRAQGLPRIGGQYAGQISESDDCWESEEFEFEKSIERPLYKDDDDEPSEMVAES